MPHNITIISHLSCTTEEAKNFLNLAAGLLKSLGYKSRFFLSTSSNIDVDEVARISLADNGIDSLNFAPDAHYFAQDCLEASVKASRKNSENFPFYLIVEELTNLTVSRLGLIKELIAEKAGVAIGVYSHTISNTNTFQMSRPKLEKQGWFMLDASVIRAEALFKIFDDAKNNEPWRNARKLESFDRVHYSKQRVAECNEINIRTQNFFHEKSSKRVVLLGDTNENPIDAGELISSIVDLNIDFSNTKFTKVPITIYAPISSWSGYGEYAVSVFACFVKMGFDVRFSSINGVCDKVFLHNKHIQKRYHVNPEKTELGVIIHPPNSPGILDRIHLNTCLFSMWETTAVPPQYAKKVLNHFKHIIVPNEWCKKSFESTGTTSPINIVPLGINNDFFRYASIKNCEKTKTHPFVFGTAGRLLHGGVRKGVEEVVRAFCLAFDKEDESVLLKVKIYPDDEILVSTDLKNLIASRKNVILNKAIFSTRQLRQWMEPIHCYVSGSKAEGWGLVQHQMASMGKGIITPFYSGLASGFLKESDIYSVPFKEALTENTIYEGSGLWATFTVADIANQMTLAYNNVEDLKRRGISLAMSARRFDLKHMFYETVSAVNNWIRP